MQNGDDFGFRGCDRENCWLMWGRKEKKDGDFVGWRERVGVMVRVGGVWWGKEGIRGLIKVTRECFILSELPC